MVDRLMTYDIVLQDRTGQDRTGQDRTGQDRTGQADCAFFSDKTAYFCDG